MERSKDERKGNESLHKELYYMDNEEELVSDDYLTEDYFTSNHITLLLQCLP